MDYRYSGIVLNSREVSEADRVYTIFTLETGKIRVLGKGVRKINAKLAGFLEPLTQAEIFISRGKGLGQISGSLIENNFPAIRSNWELSRNVFAVFKLADKLVPEQQKDEEAFRLLLSYLETLEKLSEEKNEKIALLRLGFLFKFTRQLGYGLEAEKCLACGKVFTPGENFFSPGQGGFLCARCPKDSESDFPVKDSSIKIIRIFAKNHLKNLTKLAATPEEIRDLEKIAKRYLIWVEGA
ncbi:MAG: DNA repair protein RecO [Candidatus Moranbacteria bacterium CG_4_9_14_3_um_filter_40_7]|nr:MAG: DNA repair protein RecO [Candidatus Moranbacteria bacterium CG23_combo_of_CG06-09_8_20_14_all_40_16]PIU80456.1 MAG: DNA repair protein RecO [Candidatus Moranbacteria bacterium CG06_land_8_20_14_3_00_40_12]PJA87957.1 MAG: DNA repair protein RecO [Candidatus Moranbacteria bacterium CG_4_9_14_3_um_filter_40_7]